jgi:anti-anti-sigma factor
MTAFDLRLQRGDRRADLIVTGDFDMTGVEPFARAVLEAENEDPSLLVVDMRDVTYVDSAALRVLMRTAKRAKQKGFDVIVVRPANPSDRMLTIVGLERFVKLLDEPPSG